MYLLLHLLNAAAYAVFRSRLSVSVRCWFGLFIFILKGIFGAPLVTLSEEFPNLLVIQTQ